MGAAEFGRLMGRAMAEQGISQNRLASRLGELPDGRIFDATQIRLIREGRRRLDRELVQRLIELLNIDWAEGWATSGLLPPGVTADHLRKLDLVAAGAKAVSPGRPRAVTQLPDRRQRDRRREDRPLKLVS